jgi:4-diphosphocytidyl-2-C-methyl-D-erythritol kinase
MAVRNAGGQDGVSYGRIAVALGKKIPVGAGLGGGSSDAARTLLALDALDVPDNRKDFSDRQALSGRQALSTGRAAEDLSAFAARFGSDLSFFIVGNGSAICRGRGEQVTPIAPPAARWAVLILPGESMPTPAVYHRFDELRLGRAEDVERDPDWNAWVKMPAEYLLGCLVNDLEAAAFAIAPRLGVLRVDAEQLLGRPVRMSGSGSSLFTLYDAEDEARDAAELAAARFKHRVECVELATNFADDLNASVAEK